VTTENNEVPETADPELLERSERLTEEARGSAHEALAETEDDPGPETRTGQEFPVPGDEQDAAERF
jgi:HEAT repeat protein